jgi:hypothetical protein
MTVHAQVRLALRVVFAVAAVAALAAAPAEAAIFYVGAPWDRACDFTDLQSAIDHAQTVPGGDVIRVAAGQAYEQQALVIDDEGALNVVGGYNDCADTTSGYRSWLRGEGGPAAPIISVRGSGTVKLHFLEITDNVEGKGLEVDCAGCTVQLLDVGIRGNAQGVWVSTTNCWGACPAPARLIVGANVQVSQNRSFGEVGQAGAGIAVHAAVLDMSRAAGSEVSYNAAARDGGGIYLSTQAWGFIGASVFYNTAEGNGGGIAVVNGSRLLLYPTGPESRPRIFDNRATGRGGALFVAGGWPGPESSVIGWDTAFEGNRADDGGAVSVAAIAGGTARLCLRSLAAEPEADGPCPERAPREAVRCPATVACNVMVDNVADDLGAAVMSRGAGTRVHLSHQRLTSNFGWSVVSHEDTGGQARQAVVRIDDSLVARNRPLFATVLNLSALRTTVRRCTVADNEAVAFYLYDSLDFELTDSIVWEPGDDVLFRDGAGGTDLVRMVLASEVDSLGPAPDVQAAPDPGFMSDAEYGLREDSPAVDFSDSVTAVRDLAGNPRGVGLPGVFDRFGPTDLGAYERQPVPIVTSP